MKEKDYLDVTCKLISGILPVIVDTDFQRWAKEFLDNPYNADQIWQFRVELLEEYKNSFRLQLVTLAYHASCASGASDFEEKEDHECMWIGVRDSIRSMIKDL